LAFNFSGIKILRSKINPKKKIFAQKKKHYLISLSNQCEISNEYFNDSCKRILRFDIYRRGIFTACSAIMNFLGTLKKRDLFSWKQSQSNQNLHAFAVAGVIKTSSAAL
jgi:hypothetical protein